VESTFLGIEALIFQWEEWAYDLPQWYVITIKHGPVRKLKKNIHYIIDDTHFSYLVYEPHMFVLEPFRANKSFIAYDRGNSYCDRKYTARVDLINRLYQNNTVNTRCFKYYYNTSRCNKRQELLQCKYATGPLSLSMDRFGVIPDLKKNAPGIACGDLCFLHRNYTLNRGTRMIIRVTRDGGAFLLFSLVIGGLIRKIIALSTNLRSISLIGKNNIP